MVPSSIIRTDKKNSLSEGTFNSDISTLTGWWGENGVEGVAMVTLMAVQPLTQGSNSLPMLLAKINSNKYFTRVIAQFNSNFCFKKLNKKKSYITHPEYLSTEKLIVFT